MRSGNYRSTLHLKGFKRSDPFPKRLRRLRNMNKRMNLIYRAMGKAATDMRDAMEAGAPVRSGVLSQSFRIRKLKKTPMFVAGIRVGAVSGPRVVSPNQLGYISGVSEGDTYQMAGWRDHFAELGTVYHSAHPHVQPAIRKHLSTYNLKLRKALAEIINNTKGV